MRSNKPNAIDFQNRVAEILKELRVKGKYELERRNEILNERLIELEISNQERENTITELEEKINNLQYIEEKREDNPITIVSRVIHLGLLSRELVDSILRDTFVNINGRECNVEHPDKRTFISNLSSISRKLGIEKKNRYGTFPTISKKHRRNVYYERDYVSYGDDIIRLYFLLKPFIEWGIDIDWRDNEEEALF